MTDFEQRFQIVSRSFVPGGIEHRFPGSYCAVPGGVCLRPIICDGDVLLVSPTLPPVPGSFVLIWLQPGDGGTYVYAKRLLLPFPHFKQDGTGPLVAVEMFQPARRFGLDMKQVRAVHSIVGLSRGGIEPMREMPACYERGRLQ